MKDDNTFRLFSLSMNWTWLILFALLPFCLVSIASFLTHDESHLLQFPMTISNYHDINNSIYLKIFNQSFYLAGICTLICLTIGYPFAYAIARIENGLK